MPTFPQVRIHRIPRPLTRGDHVGSRDGGAQLTTKIATAVATFLLFVVIFIAAATASTAALLGGEFRAFSGSGPSGTDASSCAATGAPVVPVPGYSPEQTANAATIVAIGKRMGIPQQGIVTAVAAALQESGLHNLDHGDLDSLGLFQQRPSQGWGTPKQITNPDYAATAFYRHLLTIPNWQKMSLNDLAQTIQKSANPTAYGRHEPAARALTAAVAGATCTPHTPGTPAPAAPNQAAQQAIAFARAQIGRPYLWGGNGPTNGDPGFDCSGLTTAAYAAAGIQLPRTAHITQAELQPGDLVFYGNPNTTIHHVGLYIGANQMIDAPTYGQPVGIHPIRHPGDDFAGAGRVMRTQQ